MIKITKPFLISLIVANLVANDDTKLSINGSTGLLETPNARVINDWHSGFFLNIDNPYQYYGFVLTPLPFLETNFHITKIDSEGTIYKDKAFNFKLLLTKERDNIPSIAFGVNNLFGDNQYSSKYVAVSKKIPYFDFTIGYAKGRLGGEDIKKYYKDDKLEDDSGFNFIKNSGWSGGKFFAGVEFFATKKLSIMAEYSPIDYSKDAVNPFANDYQKPSTHFNFGFKYKIYKNLLTTLSLQRGNRIFFGFSTKFGLKERKLNHKIVDLKDLGSQNIKIKKEKDNLIAELENKKYNNEIEYITKAIKVLNEKSDKKNLYFTLIIKNNNLKIKKYRINKKEYQAYQKGLVSDRYMADAVEFSNILTAPSKKIIDKDFSFRYEPKIKNFLHSSNRIVSSKISIDLGYQYPFANGIFLSNNFNIPLYENLDNIDYQSLKNDKLSENSELFDYEREDGIRMENLTLDIIKKTFYNSYSKAEFGYFESKYAGIDLEWFKPSENEKFGFGFEYQKIYKRDLNSQLSIYDKNYNALFLNLYYYISPKYNTHLNLKVGEFLAGDRGAKIDFVRHYKSFSLGAYATFTNSDKFNSKYNKNYVDKGIYLKIPLNAFSSRKSKEKISYTLTPWNRNVGEFAKQTTSLHNMLNNENNIQNINNNIMWLKR